MQFDFDRVIDRRNTGSVKWDRYPQPDMIPLWLADMDFLAPPAVREALRHHAETAVLGYTQPWSGLIETVLAMVRREHHWEIDPSWIVWTPNLVSAMHVLARTVGTPGDGLLNLLPGYPQFLRIAEPAGMVGQADVMVCRGGRYEIDFDRFERAITDRTRLFILCNPHNPTGRILTRAELAHLAEICLRHDILICSDEMHCGLLLDADKPHVSIATMSAELATRTVTLLSPAKTYNVAGVGVSLAIIPDATLRRRFRHTASHIVPFVTAPALACCQAAYRDCEDWRQALLAYLRTNRDLVEHVVADLRGVTMAHPEATYLAWLDCRELALPDLAGFFEAAGVALGSGDTFGTPGYLRLNYGLPRTVLAEALRRMAAALADRVG